MENKHETYTYTARNATNPDKVVTFTLYDGHMRVNLTGFLDQAGTVSQAEEKAAEIKEQVAAQAKPVAVKLSEGLSGPVHVNDVDASLADEELQVTLWQRVGGLRLAPVLFRMGKIDNNDAAQAFIKELNQRQEQESHVGKFSGPLDYWLGWAGLILVIGFLLRWPRREKDSG